MPIKITKAVAYTLQSKRFNRLMSLLSEQLPLAVHLRDDATFDNYHPGDNALILEELRRQGAGGERYIYLFGGQGSGKSHLLQAACHQATELGGVAVYLPLKDLLTYDPAVLFEGLDQVQLVCLDDIDQVVGDPVWDRALFKLFNELADNHSNLLIAANNTVAELSIGLPDLTSRLSWGTVFHIYTLNDQQRLDILRLRAQSRGMDLSDDVAQYIYSRCQRDTNSLISVVQTLDKVSLQEKRRLTMPFVKDVLGW